MEGRKSKIKIFADEYDSLELKLNKESRELKETAKFNKKLKNSIINMDIDLFKLKQVLIDSEKNPF